MPFELEYLRVLNGPLAIGGNPVSSVLPSGTGALTATKYSDMCFTDEFAELAINFTITAVAGTFASGQGLILKLHVLDSAFPSDNVAVSGNAFSPPLIIVLNSTAITAATGIRVVITRSGTIGIWIGNTFTSLGTLNVPQLWLIEFNISGTSPSFTIQTSYEARR